MSTQALNLTEITTTYPPTASFRIECQERTDAWIECDNTSFGTRNFDREINGNNDKIFCAKLGSRIRGVVPYTGILKSSDHCLGLAGSLIGRRVILHAAAECLVVCEHTRRALLLLS